MSEPLLRALARLRAADPRRRDAGPRRRLRPPARHAAAAGAASSCGTSTSRPDATSRSRRTTTRRRTPPTTPLGDAGRARRSTTCSTSRSATGTSTPPPRPTSSGSPRRARRSCTPAPGRPTRPSWSATTTATSTGCCAEDDPVFRALGLSDHQGRMKPSRQSKYRQVEEFLRILDASISEALDKGHLRRPTPERAARDRRPRLRQRLPDLRHRALPDPRPRAARPPDRHRPARAVARAQREDRRRARRRRDASSPPRSSEADARRAARRRPRPARLRHRHRRRAGPRDRVGDAAGPRRALLPPRHRRPAPHARPRPRRTPCSPGTASSASASPTPSPTACARRCCGWQGYRVDVMQFVGSQHTPRNTLLRARPHRRAGRRRLRPPGVRRAGRRPGACGPRLASSSAGG